MPHKGYKQTLEHRMKVSAFWKGRAKSPEHRTKLVAHLQRLRESGIIPTDFGGKRHTFPKGHRPWNTGLPTNPGLEKMFQLPHGMLGKHLSPEHRTKISVKLMGNRNNGGIGASNSFYGKHHTAEFIEARRKAWVGQGNPMYLDGQHPQHYPPNFHKQLKRQIRERDNYICQLCGIPQNGRNHDVHHIDYDKYNLNEDNLITLCAPCNARVNFNRMRWQEYLTNLMIVRHTR